MKKAKRLSLGRNRHNKLRDDDLQEQFIEELRSTNSKSQKTPSFIMDDLDSDSDGKESLKGAKSMKRKQEGEEEEETVLWQALDSLDISTKQQSREPLQLQTRVSPIPDGLSIDEADWRGAHESMREKVTKLMAAVKKFKDTREDVIYESRPQGPFVIVNFSYYRNLIDEYMDEMKIAEIEVDHLLLEYHKKQTDFQSKLDSVPDEERMARSFAFNCSNIVYDEVMAIMEKVHELPVESLFPVRGRRS